MKEISEVDVNESFFKASRKAQWLKGCFCRSFKETEVLNFMTENPIKTPYWASGTRKYVEQCKRELDLDDKALLLSFEVIEKCVNYFSSTEIDTYHPILEDTFAGLVAPRFITQFFLEKDELEMNEDLNKICQLEGDFNFQTGELITISMFPDVIPSGNYYVKNKITHFHELGIMRKYWLAPT